MNLVGFDKISSNIIHSFDENKLHHAILIDGKKGSGKASFVKEISKKLSGNDNLNNPDILLIEKESDKKEITVDKIRNIFDFITQTSAISKNKFIIIDSACQLNKSASNALLKILEEPRQNNFLFLISHSINKILPTIKSRCFIVKASTITQEQFYQIIKSKNSEISENELLFLSEICDNSPATAINFGEEIKRFYELFLRSLLIDKISDSLQKIISDKNFNFEIFIKSYEFFNYRFCKILSQNEFITFFEEDKVFTKLKEKYQLEQYLKISENNLNLLHQTIPFNLSKKLGFINIFNNYLL